MTGESNDRQFPWALFLSELIGTALLVLVGLSLVIRIGPIVGMLLAVLACSFLAKRIEVAKLYHFESDRDRLFRRMARPG